jgi:hypothetical protein
VTRADVAKSILKALKEAHTPKVCAKKLEQHPEDIAGLKLWRSTGFPLGNHAYAHLSLNASTADEFDQNVAANEPELQSRMGRQDWH